MKKLMIAAAVLSVAVGAMAVESANVVGYQQNAVPNGYKMVTPTFANIDGSEYNIDNLVVEGAPDTMADIQVMSSEGRWVGQYYWYNEFTDPGTGTVYPAGWFDFNGVEPANITLKPGDSVFFSTNQDDATIRSSGSVPGEITINTPNGYTMIGNGSPVAISIDSMVVTGAPDTMADIQTMSSEGRWVGQYYWYNEFTDPGTGTVYPAGWFDFNGVEPAGITLQPGDAVFFSTNQNGVKVTIPSAL